MQQLGRRVERTGVGSRSLRRREGVRGCRGEEWPHAQSILREEQGCQEGPPWVWLSVSLRTGCCPAAALVRGDRALSFLSSSPRSQVAHRAMLGPRRGGQGLRVAGSPQRSHHGGLPCPPAFWGKGCRAASDWPSWEKGGGGAGRVDACVCFQF